MATVTYYVILPFARNDAGELCPHEAIECSSSSAAVLRAVAVAAVRGGAVAFSRSGDPQTGEFADALILARIGDVPADLELVSGA